MGLIKEPLDVDFTVDPRELTQEEKSAISEYIRAYKAKETESNQKSLAINKGTAGKIVGSINVTSNQALGKY